MPEDAVGVDYADVVDTLEHDGIATFEESWSNLADRLSERLGPDDRALRHQNGVIAGRSGSVETLN
jgi:hypothetical protein